MSPLDLVYELHNADEWLGLSSLHKVIEMFARTLFSYLGHAY